MTFQIPSRVEEYLQSANDFALNVQGLSSHLGYDPRPQNVPVKQSKTQLTRPLVYYTPQVYNNYSPFTYALSQSLANWLFPPRHRVEHYYHPTTPFNSSTPFSTSFHNSQKKGAQKGIKIILAVAALGAATLIGYSLGRDFAVLGETSIDQRQLDRDKAYHQSYTQASRLPPYLRHQFQDIFDIQQDILDAYKTQCYRNIFVKGLTASGLTLASLSYLFKQSSSLTTAGGIMALGGAALWIIKLGFDQTQSTTQKLANQLFQSVSDLKQDLGL